MFRIRSLVQTCVPAILAGLLWGCDAPKALEPDTVPSNRQESGTIKTSGTIKINETTRIYWEHIEKPVGPLVFGRWKNVSPCKQVRTISQQYAITDREVVQRLKNGVWVSDRNWTTVGSLEMRTVTTEERTDPDCECNTSNYMVISPLKTVNLSVDGSIPMNNDTFLFPSTIDPDGEPTDDCHDQGTSG